MAWGCEVLYPVVRVGGKAAMLGTDGAGFEVMMNIVLPTSSL
jgi:hypothetical protein